MFSALRNTRRLVALALFAFTAVILAGETANAQNGAIVLPYTISTVAGGGTPPASGGVCSNGNIAVGTLGNNCPATQATFGSDDLRAGIYVDAAGNIYQGDTTATTVRRIDARSGVITNFAGGGAVCSSTTTPAGTPTTAAGDGCLASQTVLKSLRGVGGDPYGNLLVAGYNDNLVHVLCNAVSPICSAAQVGTMQLVAGCVASSTSYGASQSSTSTIFAPSGDGGPATFTGTCLSGSGSTQFTLHGVDQPRGANADRFGNVFIADTAFDRYRVVLGPASYNGVTNPLIAALTNATYTAPTPGNIYPILGTGSTSGAPAAGATCGLGIATDAYGDGCPYASTVVTTTGGAIQAVAADSNGNVFFAEGGRIRIFYVGGSAVANAIVANNQSNTNGPITTTSGVHAGYVYLLAGLGANNNPGFAPTLGTTTAFNGTDSNTFRLVVDGSGNLYIADGTYVLFYDMTNGYIRKLGTPTAITAPACTGGFHGDGCGVGAASFSGASSALGIGIDAQNNLYLGDGANFRIRKVSSVALSPLPTGTSVTSTFATGSILVHSPTIGGVNSTAITAANATGSKLTLGAPNCAVNAPNGGAGFGDNTYDCLIPVSFAPTQLGISALPTTLTPTAGFPANVGITGVGTGTGIVFDPAFTAGILAPAPQTTLLGPSANRITPAGIAIDGFGNVYTTDKFSKTINKLTGTTATAISAAYTTVPSQLAVDVAGNVYAATGTGIDRYFFTAPSTYAAVSTLTSATFTNPTSIAVDPQGILYIGDATSKMVYRYVPSTGITSTISKTAFGSIASIALDNNGNVLVADNVTPNVYRLSILTGVATAVTTSSITKPTYVAADQANNIYIYDAATGYTSMVTATASPAQVVTYTGSTTNTTGIALDGNANLYLADSTVANVTEVNRSSTTLTFPDGSTTFSGLLTNVGSSTATGYVQSNTTQFSVASVNAGSCFAATTILPGATCAITASFAPPSGTSATYTGTVTYSPTTTAGALNFTATTTGGATTISTTTVTGPTTAVYAPSPATEITFTVAVTTTTSGTTSPAAASSTVNVTVDSATTAYMLGTNGTVSVPLSGLSVATMHTISAAFPAGQGANPSSSVTTTFAITQAPTTLAWTPATNSGSVSNYIGLTVLNAAGQYMGTTIPGSTYYTTTIGGVVTPIDAASYLPIGSYTINATFYPTDALDYVTSTGTISFTVNKALTTAAVSGSTNVVAADGSGNYTTLAAAVAALPTTGGAIYIAPGTYTGQTVINYPNVSLRGLGGNPANIVLTAETGGFTSTTGYPYAGQTVNGTTAGQYGTGNGINGDPGSATLLVQTNTVNGTSYSPTGFYIENLSIFNTYDTDTATNNTVRSGSPCTTGNAPARSFDLYMSGTLCASQALAIQNQADQSVYNNVRLYSLQDTISLGNSGLSGSICSTCTVARQYFFKGYITGDIDYVFGDGAAAFDQTTFYTQYHNGSTSGDATIFAQSKGASSFLSGYVVTRSIFTSQTAQTAPQIYGAGISGPMTLLNLGRPYGMYSTTVILNSSIDDNTTGGWEEFGGGRVNLPTSTYYEFNNSYATAGANTGRETTSAQPVLTTAATAAFYAPLTFLGQTGGTNYPATTWNAAAALATNANAFVPSATTQTVNYGSSVTLLARPQTPGAGIIATGAYALTDNGGTTLLASGNLDASGNVYFTTSSLAPGTHHIGFTYNGDANFYASSASNAFTITVNGTATTTSVATTTTTPTYGSSTGFTVTVSPSTAQGTVNLTIDSGTASSGTLTNGVATFNVPGLSAGMHSLSATYVANGAYTTSTGTGTVTLAKANLNITASSFNRGYETPNPTLTYTPTGFVNNDTAAVLSGSPMTSTTAQQNSLAGTYPIVIGAGSLTASNYTFTFVNGSITVTGGNAQTISFPALPSLPGGGTYQLFARSSSGLPITYTVTGTGASINGSALTVGPSGSTVTVTATQPGNTTFAAAGSVQQSFTAQ